MMVPVPPFHFDLKEKKGKRKNWNRKSSASEPGTLEDKSAVAETRDGLLYIFYRMQQRVPITSRSIRDGHAGEREDIVLKTGKEREKEGR